MRIEVLELAEAMEAKLQAREHLYPNGWDDTSTTQLYDKMADKLEKYVAAVSAMDREKVLPLAADISNYLMMISDKVMKGYR